MTLIQFHATQAQVPTQSIPITTSLIQKNVKTQLMIMLRVTRIQTQRIRVQSKAMSILRIHL